MLNFRHLTEIWKLYSKPFVFTTDDFINIKSQLKKRGVTTASAVLKVPTIQKFLQFHIKVIPKSTRPHAIW